MRVVLPSRDWPAGLAHRISPLRLLPDDLRAWIRQAVGGDLPVGTALEIVSEREGTTDAGWAMRLVEARAVERGAVREVRIAALYAFFEHGASVVISAASSAALEPHVEALVGWLRGARPDFSGEPAALAQLYDLEDPAPAPARSMATPEVRPDPRFSAEARLARLAGVVTPEARREKAALLLELGKPAEALASVEELADVSGLRGRALAMLGRMDDAAAAWRAAAATDPTDATSRYNLGLVLFDRGDAAGARTVWREAAAAAPDDFLIRRKIVQAEHRLGLWDDAAASRRELRQLWQTTSDPRAHLVGEAVIDQIDADGRQVFAFETYRPRDPTFHPVFRFVEVDRAGHELPHSVVIETSDYAKERGAPYVIVVWNHGAHEIIGTAPDLPPYPELRATALELLNRSSGPVPPTRAG